MNTDEHRCLNAVFQFSVIEWRDMRLRALCTGVLLLAAGLLAVVVIGVLLRPLFKTPAAVQDRATYDMTVFQDQLKEVDRDVERGVMTPTEAEAAHAEYLAWRKPLALPGSLQYGEIIAGMMPSTSSGYFDCQPAARAEPVSATVPAAKAVPRICRRLNINNSLLNADQDKAGCARPPARNHKPGCPVGRHMPASSPSSSNPQTGPTRSAIASPSTRRADSFWPS